MYNVYTYECIRCRFGSRYSGEPSRPSQHLISVRRNQSSFEMACLGRFYVLGPPVQNRDGVMELTTTVMQQTPYMTYAPWTLLNMEGPVRYDSSWVPGGRREVLRQGLEVADLWTGQVLWHYPAFARSFSVVVIDQQYVENHRGHRRNWPDFETFVVAVLQNDQPGVSKIYEWRVNAPSCGSWMNRGHWRP